MKPDKEDNFISKIYLTSTTNIAHTYTFLSTLLKHVHRQCVCVQNYNYLKCHNKLCRLK